jgi:hypothetical protein
MEQPSVFLLKDLSLENLSIDNFERHDKIGSASILLNNSDQFFIKTGFMTILKTTPTYLDLCTSELDKFNDIDEHIISLIPPRSSLWFGSSFSLDEVDDLFQRTVKSRRDGNICRIYYDPENIQIYNKKQTLLTVSDLTPSTKIKCILKCENIQFREDFCFLKWKIQQALISQQEKPSTVFLLNDDEK